MEGIFTNLTKSIFETLKDEMMTIPEKSLKNPNNCVIYNSNYFIIIICCLVSFVAGFSVGFLINRIQRKRMTTNEGRFSINNL